jgi:hypothetical protein
MDLDNKFYQDMFTKLVHDDSVTYNWNPDLMTKEEFMWRQNIDLNKCDLFMHFFRTYDDEIRHCLVVKGGVDPRYKYSFNITKVPKRDVFEANARALTNINGNLCHVKWNDFNHIFDRTKEENIGPVADMTIMVKVDQFLAYASNMCSVFTAFTMNDAFFHMRWNNVALGKPFYVYFNMKGRTHASRAFGIGGSFHCPIIEIYQEK